MRFVLFVIAAAIAAPLLHPQERQTRAAAGAFQPYLGSWRGVCADGRDFVVLTLQQEEGGRLGGTIQLANMRGGEDGRCVKVVDPPSKEHALKVTDGKVVGAVLQFKGAGRMEFEMTGTGEADARLKFIGTASEENPWELKRAK